MRVGVVMTIYNRPWLTRQALGDLASTSDLKPGTVVLLVNDCSTDEETNRLWDDFTLNNNGVAVVKIRNRENQGIKRSLLIGISILFVDYKCDVVTNLDNDVRLKRTWLQDLLALHENFKHDIITGFHSLTRNRDGSERHRVVHEGDGYCIKKSVGGINMLFTEAVYLQHIYPALQKTVGNWDHEACLSNGRAICTVPSVVQHTGVADSSLGHNQEEPDIAADFIIRYLPTVTLVGVDNVNPDKLRAAAEISRREIQFGAELLLTTQPICNKEEYSRFMLRHLHSLVHTKHMLVIQADGYVLNASAWQEEWLEYDYVGATWGYKDGMNVGNGGFSLRSKRLMERVSKLEGPTHPEDHVICRHHRPLLEREGFTFALEEVANRFSIEAYGAHVFAGATQYSGQFGFHGWGVDFSNAKLPHVPVGPVRKPAARRGVRLL